LAQSAQLQLLSARTRQRHLLRRLRRSAVVAGTATAVVLGGASGALATPVSAPDVTVLGTWLQPLLVAQATDTHVTGGQALIFYARHVGAST
jgi:hypothetical protein